MKNARCHRPDNNREAVVVSYHETTERYLSMKLTVFVEFNNFYTKSCSNTIFSRIIVSCLFDIYFKSYDRFLLGNCCFCMVSGFPEGRNVIIIKIITYIVDI